MEAYLSDAGNSVLVIRENGEEEEFSVEGFVFAFGPDALPKRKYFSDSYENISQYYLSGERMCLAAGEYSWAIKLRENSDEGVFPTQKIKYHYFSKQGNADANLEIAIEQRSRSLIQAIENFDFWSRKVGFKPMSGKDKNILSDLLCRERFRRRFLAQVRKNMKRKKLVSARDMVIKVHKLIRKSIDKIEPPC